MTTMKLSPNAAHVIAILLASAGAVLHFLQVNPDISNEAHVTSNALITLGFVIALVSQSVFGTATPPTPTPLAGTDKDPVTAAADALKPPAAHRGFLGAAFVGFASALAVVIGIACSASSTACTTQQVQAAGTALVQIAVDACQEAPSVIPPNTPAGTVVGLICSAVNATASAVNVLIDAKTWDGMKASYLQTHPSLPAGMSPPSAAALQKAGLK
jgi:hypothetical protein